MRTTPFVDRLSQYVAADVQVRGETYFRRGVVKLIGGDATECNAVVRGTYNYDVDCHIDPQAPDTIFSSCTCPYAIDNVEPCKHIWATILAAHARGWLTGRGVSLEYVGMDPDGFDESAFDDGDGPPPYDFRRPARARPKPPRKASKPDWQLKLESMTTPNFVDHRNYVGKVWPAQKEVIYVVDSMYMHDGSINVQVMNRERLRNGELSKPRNGGPPRESLHRLADAADREICAALLGADQYSYGGFSAHSRYTLSRVQVEAFWPRIVRTGRCLWKLPKDYIPLVWDEGDPWRFAVDVVPIDNKKYRLTGWLQRGEQRQPVHSVTFASRYGVVIIGNAVGRLDDRGAPGWLDLFRKQQELLVPAKEFDRFLKLALAKPEPPPFELPADLAITVCAEPPVPIVRIKPPRFATDRELEVEVKFQYGDQEINPSSVDVQEFDVATRTLRRRDTAAESAFAARLQSLRFRRDPYNYQSTTHFRLLPKDLAETARVLTAEGWRVEAEGKLYRPAGKIDISVTSGIDWFELHGKVEFGDTSVDLPRILAAVRKQQTTVELDDGTMGILPDDWLKQYGILASVGTADKDHIRFRRNQVGLLDALLAAQPDVDVDAAFRKAREQFRNFHGVEAADPPDSFVGQLRPYQCDGLGWLKFLRQFGFGGCLADDMGLGKTVQVLAMLDERKVTRSKREPRPSLAVVPKSLVFNWKAEAARFTPNLRVLDHTGKERCKDLEQIRQHDLVLTTYGTLRNDAALFRDFEFDYCILDESQAVKNASTESSKAVRLLHGQHRLAMSGTPIENHLGELWSLFDFLNPGMLGQAGAFKAISGAGKNPDPAGREVLAQALRPFILRRTKDQVAKDLPQKTEQTVYCDLDDAQRQLYNELRDYYRQALLTKVATDGMAKSKIMVLEALLRLRQAACHPGLLDKKKVTEPSAKLEILLPKLQEAFEEGHKALVFSQFTSLLDIVRKRLDLAGVPYEYLDGKTRDRQARVEHFQNDPECKLFLISLKAGGVGLNLTAAEYVFLLDPWWNPAVEAQAIDRTHRIGQTRPVFAYRLIARDTVEEKVLALQETKKALADAIITADNSLIRDLKKEDLEVLLS